ncbi:MAG: hypothetical protein JWM11_2775 [Planctomycetaceae bacterium]|nr:hypothetical protein [Planctomycetaceae bacterium]
MSSDRIIYASLPAQNASFEVALRAGIDALNDPVGRD